MTLLSPWALLVAVAAVVPLIALALALRKVERLRAMLRLERPPAARWRHAAAVAAVPILLGLAAAQPALQTTRNREVRTDAEAFVILDVSRSMLAAPGRAANSRLERAKAVALRIRAALGPVPTGVASLTDRVLPHLFPTADDTAFEQTVRRAIQPESPPPRETSVTATNLGALAEAARGNLFSPSARRKVFVVLTDGESRPFAETGVARALGANNIRLVSVHVWRADERVYAGRSTPERVYRPDAGSRDTLAALAAATGGEVSTENEIGKAARAAAGSLGEGPTEGHGAEERVTPLAPYVALAALVPLAAALRRRAA